MSCCRWFNVAVRTPVISASCCVVLSLLCLWRWRLLRSEWDAQHTRSDPSSLQHGEECCATEETRGVDFTFNECMRNIQKWHLKHPRPYLCIFNQRPPDGARVRSFHDLHTVVEILPKRLFYGYLWMLTCVACGYMGRVVSLSLYYKTSKCSQMKDLKGRAFPFFFLCRERYRPSWICTCLCQLVLAEDQQCLYRIIHNNCRMWPKLCHL